MSALVFKITTDGLVALGAKARAALVEAPMADAGGRAVKLLLVDHFTDMNAERANKLGGARTNFYADAARSVQEPVTLKGTATVSINKLGLAQRLLGGPIRALAPHKYLAIPATAEAYGHTPADFPHLQFFKTKRGGGLKAQRAVASVVGYIRSGKNKGKSRAEASVIGDVVLFWLVPEVTQAPDPAVLPEQSDILLTAYEAMDNFLTRRLASN